MIHTGYCTNVHAGADLATTQANLEKYALEVKRLYSPDRPMGVGLWLAAGVARTLREEQRIRPFADWLRAHGLVPFTLNGFPYGNFHQAVVKHDVYQPTWWQRERLDYTLDLIALLDQLLDAGQEGSISTLPIAWGTPHPSEEQIRSAGEKLRAVADHLRQLEERTGRLIYLCLEPEPGCLIDSAEDLRDFFQTHLLGHADDAHVRRHLRICHDVCHSAVMFEPQNEAFRIYQDAGILVGKVQVSAAVWLPMHGLALDERLAALNQLESFHEPRYLHQTVVRSQLEHLEFFEDLPEALAFVRLDPMECNEMRTHFHVPIYLERFDRLWSSQDDIRECLRSVTRHSHVTHFEVETYAWGVLPQELRQTDLATGIAEELRWFDQLRAEFKL